MKKLCILIIFLSHIVADEEENKNEEKVDKEEYKHPLSLPIYIYESKQYISQRIILFCELLASLVIMTVPIPIISFLTGFVTVGTGVMLTFIHLAGSGFAIFVSTYLVPTKTIWIIGLALVIVAVIFSGNFFVSGIILSIIGSYIFSYFNVIIFGITTLHYFALIMVISLIALLVGGFFYSNAQYVIVKSAICTMTLCVMLDIMTPLKVISSMHGETWPLSDNIKNATCISIYLISFALFSLVNYIREKKIENKD